MSSTDPSGGPVRGLALHVALSLRLNFRSPQAVVYGFLVPLFFLLAFGSVFRAGQPVLLREMGQLLVITILGGACFGLPTAMVAERERGVWRRYRLLPVAAGALVGSAVVVRLVLVGLAVALQIVAAHLLFDTPWPAQPVLLAAAVVLVTLAFCGLGLVIAALAVDVPAVQALGQCLFLPMIMIGGVGVPLAVLPEWAQVAAAFMPGRYAVELVQPAYVGGGAAASTGFALVALVLIGGAAAFIGLKLFRWDNERPTGVRARLWAGGALLAWAVVGVVAVVRDRVGPVPSGPGASFLAVTAADLESISFERLPDDGGIYAPLAPPFPPERELPPTMLEFAPRLAAWKPGQTGDAGRRVRLLVSVAAVADVLQDPAEAAVARAVFARMEKTFERDELVRALGWVALYPEQGDVVTEAPELALVGEVDASIVRQRSAWYARKFLGRLLGRIPD